MMINKIIEELEELISVCESRIPNHEESSKDIMNCFKADSEDGEKIDKYNFKTYQIAESYHAKANDLICQSDSYKKAIEIVKKYENDGWILCSEMLPENKVNVLITRQCGSVKIAFCNVNYNEWREDGYQISTPIAWKPLPQQYKGE